MATVIRPPCPCIAATARNKSCVTVAALRARIVSPARGTDIHKAAVRDRRVGVDICLMAAAPVPPRWMAGLEAQIGTQVKAYCRLRLRFFRLHSR